MVKQDRYYGVDRYLPHAVVATAAVVVIPLIVVVSLLVALEGELAPLLAAVVGGALALIVAGIGSLLWSHSSGALDMAFSELLIWGWLRRKHAEERAARDARLLGLDSDGRPAKRARSARAQQLSILGDLSSALESKDPYTHGHSQRVERHAVRTAEELGLSIEELAELRRAANLHDVGKIRVPHRILRKPGSLTSEERKIIEQHSVVGAWLVSNVCKRNIVQAVRHHHERWDGRGYPDGLSGTDIPLYARIIAVADAFDAMTSSRPYRVAYDSRTAIGILEAEAGAQFDPDVVRAFVATVPNQVPIAAFLPFFGAGLTRKLFGGFRRTLSGSAMSGAAAAGAASIVIASLMTPIEAPMANPATNAPRHDQGAWAGPATPDDLLANADHEDAYDLKGKNSSKAEAKRASKPQSKADLKLKRTVGKGMRDGTYMRNLNKRKGPNNPETEVLSGKVDRDPNGSDAGRDSGPTNKAPEPKGNGPDGSGGGSGGGGSDNGGSDNGGSDNGGSGNGSGNDDPPAGGHNGPGDPNPDRGKDCPAPTDKKSPGRRKHCS